MKFSISHETVNELIFVHSRVFCKWTKTVYKEYLSKVREEAEKYDFPIVFCNIPLTDKKLNKFVKKIGFRLVQKRWTKRGFFAIYRMNTKCYK